MRRRSRDVLVIGEEGLLDEVDLGLLQELKPATEAALSVGIAPKLPVARDGEPAGIAPVEPEAAEKGNAEAGDFDEIGDEPRQRAPAGIDGEPEREPVGAQVPGAPGTLAPSRPRPRPSGATTTVGIAAVLVTATAIALQSGGSGPTHSDPPAERAEGEALAPRATVRRGPERRRRAASEPARGARDSRAGEQSALPVVASTTPTVTTAPAPPPASAPTPTPRPTSAPVQDASRAMVLREFGP